MDGIARYCVIQLVTRGRVRRLALCATERVLRRSRCSPVPDSRGSSESAGGGRGGRRLGRRFELARQWMAATREVGTPAQAPRQTLLEPSAGSRLTIRRFQRWRVLHC